MKEKFLELTMALLLMLAPTAMLAQAKGERGPKFSPEQYRQKEAAFITSEAKLTQKEAGSFLPLYQRMREAQRKLQMRKSELVRSACLNELSDAQSLKILNELNEIDDDILDLEEDYQKKFLKTISASKLLKVRIAIQRFERKMLRDMANKPHKRGGEGPRK